MLLRAALASLVAVLALGLALEALLGARLEREALVRDGDVAAFLAGRIERGAEPRALIRNFLTYDHRAVDHVGAWVWGARGRQAVGSLARPVPRAALAAAARGVPVSVRGPAPSELLHVVPVRDRSTGRPAGAVAVVQRAARLDREVAGLRRGLALLLAGGLALLWAALAPTVLMASRRLARQSAEAEHRARHDALTGLLDRQGFLDLLAATRAPAGVGQLDLDGFRALNALHGTARADAVLVEAARTLEAAAAPGTALARVGPDEFAVLVPGASPQDVHDELAALAAALADPSGEARALRCRGGYTAAPADGDDVPALLAHAGSALEQAKADPTGPLRRFRSADALAARSLEEQRAEIERLLATPDALEIVTQPVVAVSDGRVRGYEALTRIELEPRRGPDVWFEQARRVGLGPALEALAAGKALAVGAGRPAGTVLAVNLSPGAIASPEVRAALPADLRGVIVEITEHELAADVEGLTAALADLRGRGAGLAVDDAGAGYAGLTQTVALAPDAIKLDRTLVAGIDSDPAKAALVEAFVAFARRTGAKLCAEGVETADELRTLAWLDVDRAQGYGLARPAPGFPTVAPEAVALCRAVTAEALRAHDGAPEPLRHGVHHLAELGTRLLEARTAQEAGVLAGGLAAELGVDEVVLSAVDAGLIRARTLTPTRLPLRDEVLALHDVPRVRQALARSAAAQALVGDPALDDRGRELLARSPYRSVLLVPVAWRHRTVGLLELYLREERTFTRSEIARARVVAFQLGPVLDALTDRAPGSALVAA